MRMSAVCASAPPPHTHTHNSKEARGATVCCALRWKAVRQARSMLMWDASTPSCESQIDRSYQPDMYLFGEARRSASRWRRVPHGRGWRSVRPGAPCRTRRWAASTGRPGSVRAGVRAGVAGAAAARSRQTGSPRRSGTARQASARTCSTARRRRTGWHCSTAQGRRRGSGTSGRSAARDGSPCSRRTLRAWGPGCAGRRWPGRRSTANPRRSPTAQAAPPIPTARGRPPPTRLQMRHPGSTPWQGPIHLGSSAQRAACCCKHAGCRRHA